MYKLTIAEIVDLAALAGLVLKEGCGPDADELESEITIKDCNGDFLLDDDGVTPLYYKRIAYFSEYPEEGCIGLGEEVQPEAKLGEQ